MTFTRIEWQFHVIRESCFVIVVVVNAKSFNLRHTHTHERLELKFGNETSLVRNDDDDDDDAKINRLIIENEKCVIDSKSSLAFNVSSRYLN